MASGVRVSDSCTKVFQLVKMNLAKQEKRTYAVYKLSEDLKEIVVDDELTDEAAQDTQEQKSGGVGPVPGLKLKELVKKLPDEDARYVVYDYPYQSGGRATSKLIFILWCPEKTKIKHRMVYASSKEALKKVLNISDNFHAASIEELDDDNIVGQLNKSG